MTDTSTNPFLAELNSRQVELTERINMRSSIIARVQHELQASIHQLVEDQAKLQEVESWISKLSDSPPACDEDKT